MLPLFMSFSLPMIFLLTAVCQMTVSLLARMLFLFSLFMLMFSARMLAHCYKLQKVRKGQKLIGDQAF